MQVGRSLTSRVPTVLFVCVQNSGRSQLAKAIWNHRTKTKRAASAGSDPADLVREEVTKVLAEIGIHPGHLRPKRWHPEQDLQFDLIIRMGCGDACPLSAKDRTIDWEIPDPQSGSMESFRNVRDLIGQKIADLLAEIKSSS